MLHRQTNLVHFLNEIRGNLVKSLLRTDLLCMYYTMALITTMANWKNNKVSNELRNLQYFKLVDRTKPKHMI